jgi:hypothetical protein
MFGRLTLLTLLLLGAGAIVLVAGIMLGDVDRCLDSGGRWNEPLNACER